MVTLNSGEQELLMVIGIDRAWVVMLATDGRVDAVELSYFRDMETTGMLSWLEL